MASVEEYASWLVANKDKAGTPEFNTVAQAYQALRGQDQATPSPNPAYQKGKDEPSPLVRGLANVAQGPTFGFSDEIAGAVNAVKNLTQGKPMGEGYREGRDYLRGVQDQYRQDFPIASVATQLAASAPLLATNLLGQVPGLGRVLSPAVNTVSGPLARVGNAALQGGVQGTLSGAGESNADSVMGVASDALKAGGISAATGGVLQGVGMGAGAVGRNIASRVSDRFASPYAQQKAAEALARDATAEAFQTGTSNAVDRASVRMAKLGPEARVVDSGGQNTRRLLDTVATLPGQTGDLAERAIRERQASRAGRLISGAESALSVGNKDFGDEIEKLASTRLNAARPFYDKVSNLAVTVDDDVLSLLNKTESVHGEAEKLLKMLTGNKIDLSQVKKGDSIPFSMLDTLKQTLYDAAESAKRGGNKNLGKAYDTARVDLVSKLDDIAPKENGVSVYKLARDAYAGPSQLMDAAELGRKALKDDVFELRSTIKDFTKSEVEAFRVGALQAIREQSGSMSGQTSLLNMWREPKTSERLKIIFGNDYREFAATVAKEARLKGIESVGRGSQTAQRASGMQDLDVSPLVSAGQTVGSMAAGNPTGVLSSLGNMFGKVSTPETVRDEIGKLLLSRDPRTVQQLTGVLSQINAARARNASILGGFTGQPAGILYSNQVNQ